MHSKFFVWVLGAVLCASLGLAAQELPQRELERRSGLQSLERGAGAIFAGTVRSVQRYRAKKPNEVETVQVTFRVMHALRGARAGRDLTIREWSGLWSAGESYRVGDHVLLFLYKPSRLGLTSPVGGWQGRFAMDEQGRVVMRGGLLQEVIGQGGNSLVSANAGGGVRVNYREVFRAVQRAGRR